MKNEVIVQVPAGDVDDLERLGAQVGDDDIAMVHPFDGAAVAELMIVLTTVTLPMLREWVKLRIESRKAVVVVHQGTELRGYDAKDAERLLAVLGGTSASA